ncbi:MAG: hypothetical protein PWP23_610 [Candidatus Sumerlaeota bacterium]|nr:hypothetical protein [Candidatus Sumerlaeota bacterium]
MNSSGPLLRPIIFLLITLFLPVAAAAQELVIKISGEYGGYYRPGDWYPVNVSIENTPKDGKPGDRSLDFAGQLIVQAASAKSRYGAYDFVREVEVPAFSTQRFTLYARFPEDPAGVQPSLLVRSRNGRLLSTHKIEIQPLGKDQILIVTASEEMKRIVFPMQRRADVNPLTRATMPTRNLPELWAAYDPVDILVFPSWPGTSLSARRVQALEDWVAMGGTLVFLGGANSSSYSAAIDSDLLPVETSSSRQYRWGLDRQTQYLKPVADGQSLAGNDGMLVSIADPLPGSEVLWDAGPPEESIPMLVRRRIGRGQVLFLAVDLESVPNDFRQALLPYWLSVIETPNMLDWRHSFHAVRDNVKTVKRSTARPPNPVLIILLCILYTAAVGPVNFFLLSKRNKVQWAWLTVPVIVVLFSGLIYTLGALTKGGESVAREITLLHGYQGQRDFEEQSLITFFTHKADDFFVRAQDDRHTVSDSDRWTRIESLFQGFILDLSPAGSSGLSLRNSQPVMASEDDAVYVHRWPLRTFDSTIFQERGPARLDGPVASTLAYNNDTTQVWLSGSLENRTGFDFYGTALLWGDRVLPLGKLGSGESIELDRRATERPFYMSNSSRVVSPWKTAGVGISDVTEAPGDESDSDFNRLNAQVAVEGIFAPKFLRDLLAPMRGKLYFVGLAEDPELSVDTNLEADYGTRSIIVMVQLNPVPAQAYFTVPSQLMDVRLQDYASDPPRLTLPDKAAQPRLEIREGWGVFSCRLPFEAPGIIATSIERKIDEVLNETDQVLTVRAYSNTAGGLLQLEKATPADALRNDLLTPVTGRGWIVLEAAEAEDGNNSFGNYNSKELTEIGFEVRGLLRETR